MMTFEAKSFELDLEPLNIMPLEGGDIKKSCSSDFGARKKFKRIMNMIMDETTQIDEILNDQRTKKKPAIFVGTLEDRA